MFSWWGSVRACNISILKLEPNTESLPKMLAEFKSQQATPVGFTLMKKNQESQVWTLLCVFYAKPERSASRLCHGVWLLADRIWQPTMISALLGSKLNCMKLSKVYIRPRVDLCDSPMISSQMNSLQPGQNDHSRNIFTRMQCVSSGAITQTLSNRIRFFQAF